MMYPIYFLCPPRARGAAQAVTISVRPHSPHTLPNSGQPPHKSHTRRALTQRLYSPLDPWLSPPLALHAKAALVPQQGLLQT